MIIYCKLWAFVSYETKEKAKYSIDRILYRISFGYGETRRRIQMRNNATQ